MDVKRLLSAPLKDHPKSALILGPRQSGKSTLLKALQPDLIINLAREKEYLEHSSNPGLIEELIEGSNASLVMVDEVQRIPSLLNTIQAIIDEKRKGKKVRFLLSGSSARKLKRGQANLLPGRIVAYRLGGLSSLELKGRLDLNHSLLYGFLPEPFLCRDLALAREILGTYAGVYLKEEIQSEMLVRNIQGFSRFLQAFSEVSGHILDLSKVSSKARVSRTGASRFMEVLEETLLVHKCESYQSSSQGSPMADTVKHPRYYLFDPGVLNGLLDGFSLSKDRTGILFEHAVVAQIHNSAAATRSHIELSYFRTRNGLEVDFILKVRDKLWAIEAKWGNVSDHDAKSLRAVSAYLPGLTKKIIVTPNSPARKLQGDIHVMSLAALMEEVFT